MKQQENNFKFITIDHIGVYKLTLTDLDIKYWTDLVYAYQKDHPISVSKSNSNGYQSLDNLNLLKPFFPLVQLIQNTLNTITHPHINHMVNLWLNISPPLSYNHTHHHSSTFKDSLSGVIYLQTPPKSGDIIFHKSSDLNNGITLTPQPQEILFFPQSVYHSVNLNLSEGDRISLAFNFE